MPTVNPRVNVTLKQPSYDLLTRLAKLQDTSRAALLADLLETILPVWERVVVVGEAAQRAQVQAKQGLRESMERAEAAILPHVNAAMGQFDLLIDEASKSFTAAHGRAPGEGLGLSGAKTDPSPRAAPGRRSTPVPVTTGVRSLAPKPRKRARAPKRRARK